MGIEKIYSEGDIPIILKFYTETCNPCKSLSIIIQRLEPQFRGKVRFVKTRADENVKLAQQFRVTAVPTLIIVDSNKEIERAQGLITENSLAQKIHELIAE